VPRREDESERVKEEKRRQWEKGRLASPAWLTGEGGRGLTSSEGRADPSVPGLFLFQAGQALPRT
jgi:hypothetical protein